MDFPEPWQIETRRRSIAMLAPRAPALNKEEALVVLEQLGQALTALRDLGDK